MYIPRHFELPPSQVELLLGAAETAELVTAYPTGPVATLVPVLYRKGEGHGSLTFHLTRNNPQVREPGMGESLAILAGGDSYVAPQWLASFSDNPGVPTWNYVTVHAYGELVVRDDPDWTRQAVADLSLRHGFDVGIVPERVISAQLRAIVGMELRITRVEAKAKLSQNKTPQDVSGIIAGLRRDGEAALADQMEELSIPYAEARQELLADVRDGRWSGFAASPVD